VQLLIEVVREQQVQQRLTAQDVTAATQGVGGQQGGTGVAELPVSDIAAWPPPT
jgi:hypothetical protein